MTENNNPNDPASPVYLFGPAPAGGQVMPHSPLLQQKDLVAILQIMQNNQAHLFAEFIAKNDVLEMLYSQVSFDATQQINDGIDDSKKAIIKAVIKALDAKYSAKIAGMAEQIEQQAEQNAMLLDQLVDINTRHAKLSTRVKNQKTKIAELGSAQTALSKKVTKFNTLFEDRLGVLADVVNLIREQFWVREKMLKATGKVKKGRV